MSVDSHESWKVFDRLPTLNWLFEEDDAKKFLKEEILKPDLENNVDADFFKERLTLNGKPLDVVEFKSVGWGALSFKCTCKFVTEPAVMDVDVFLICSYDEQFQDSFIEITRVEIKNKEWKISPYVCSFPQGKLRKANLIIVPEAEKDNSAKKSDIDALEFKKLSDIFDPSVETDYYNHLALWWSHLEKNADGWFKVPFLFLRSLGDKNTASWTYDKSLENQYFLTFDARWKLISTSIKMPKFFWFARTFDVTDTGVLIENKESKSTRENLMSAQKERLESLLKNVSGHIVPNSWKISPIDVDGNYLVRFTTTAVTLDSGIRMSELSWQSFKVTFNDVNEILYVTDPNQKFFISDNKVKTEKKWFFAKNKYAFFSVDVEQDVFNIEINETDDIPQVEQRFLISWLPDVITPFYAWKSTFDVVDAELWGKYIPLIKSIETTHNGEKLSVPKEISISPLWDINGLTMSTYMQQFKKTYDSLINNLTDLDGFYRFHGGFIDKVIWEYNTPIKRKVYPIFDPKTKEYVYYTAEKVGDKIIFTEDKEVSSMIQQQRTALEKRFADIKKIQETEVVAQKTLLTTTFAKISDAWKTYNLGIYPHSVVTQYNQKATILNEKYDPNKIQYIATIILSEYAMEWYENKWLLYFNAKGEYDLPANEKYYSDNLLTINGYKWTLVPDVKNYNKITFKIRH